MTKKRTDGRRLCSYCNKPITLIPSAIERAKKFGGQASDYTNLFTMHADCLLEYRDGKKPGVPGVDRK